jgi:hypothetical protein
MPRQGESRGAAGRSRLSRDCVRAGRLNTPRVTPPPILSQAPARIIGFPVADEVRLADGTFCRISPQLRHYLNRMKAEGRQR